MNCPNCGAPVPQDAKFCGNCGVSFPETQPTVAPPIPQQGYTAYSYTPPVAPTYPVNNGQLPLEYKPLSPWAYFGYMLLFSIPVVGFICLIVFSVDSSNINRRNFARSYWITYALALIVGIIVGVLFAVFGVSFANEIGSEFNYF